MLEKFLQCSQRMGWLADFLLIVESCLTVYGAGVLESCTLELESAWLDPPACWGAHVTVKQNQMHKNLHEILTEASPTNNCVNYWSIVDGYDIIHRKLAKILVWWTSSEMDGMIAPRCLSKTLSILNWFDKIIVIKMNAFFFFQWRPYVPYCRIYQLWEIHWVFVAQPPARRPGQRPSPGTAPHVAARPRLPAPSPEEEYTVTQ